MQRRVRCTCLCMQDYNFSIEWNWRGFFLLGLHKGKWKGRWIGDVISVSQKIISEEDRFIGFGKAQILESVACFFSV
jgi:hypothetical protein